MNLPFELEKIKDCNCRTKIAQGDGSAICKKCGRVWSFDLNSGWKEVIVKTVKSN